MQHCWGASERGWLQRHCGRRWNAACHVLRYKDLSERDDADTLHLHGVPGENSLQAEQRV